MLDEGSEMKITMKILSSVDFPSVKKKINKAGEDALKDVITNIANEAKHDTPWLTGNNSRSIDFEAKGLTGSVYSTSGYGGFLETGTAKMPARPYMKPALDRHIGELPAGVEAELQS